MRTHNRFHNRQAQACTILPAVTALHGIKHVKNAFPLTFRDTLPLISYSNFDLIFIHLLHLNHHSFILW
ncbi:Uncharacterised protein [Mycobacteroides abscessus subsp. abscessus]|nr:Uncharacterised protein [Mycobacteroides abscessus subsp. abscessus]